MTDLDMTGFSIIVQTLVARAEKAEAERDALLAAIGRHREWHQSDWGWNPAKVDEALYAARDAVKDWG